METVLEAVAKELKVRFHTHILCHDMFVDSVGCD